MGVQGAEPALQLLAHFAEPMRLEPLTADTVSSRAAAALEGLASRVAAQRDTKRGPTPSEPPDSENRVAAQASQALGLKRSVIAQASQLARRERQIRERLQTLLNDSIPPQESLRSEAMELARTIEALRNRSREASPHSTGAANAVIDSLRQQGPQAMSQATAQLAHGQLDDARRSQRRAAQAIETAAQQLDDMASALRRDQPAEAGVTSSGQIAAAQDAQRRASQALAEARERASPPGAMRQAGESMRKAAQNLRAASQQTGLAQHGPSTAEGEKAGANDGKPSTAANPQGQPAGPGTADPSALKELVRGRRAHSWGELPGHLRDAILQMPEGRYREDYSRLIQLYFQEIAAGSAREDKP
jgi:hypothetical protein